MRSDPGIRVRCVCSPNTITQSRVKNSSRLSVASSRVVGSEFRIGCTCGGLPASQLSPVFCGTKPWKRGTGPQAVQSPEARRKPVPGCGFRIGCTRGGQPVSQRSPVFCGTKLWKRGTGPQAVQSPGAPGAGRADLQTPAGFGALLIFCFWESSE